MTAAADPPLRLLCVTGSLAHGGAERHAVALMNRLAERGHECHAAYVKDEAALLDRIQRGRGGTIHCLGAARYFDRRAVADLARLMDRIEPTVILAQNPYALLYAAVARSIAQGQAPLVAVFHSNRLLGIKEELQMLLYRPLFWSAACAVFVCEAQRRRWQKLAVFGRLNAVIPNGVDTDAFRPGADGESRLAMRHSLGLDDGDYVVGITAALRPEKNHLLLIDAIAALRSRGIPARALLIGDGETRPAIEERAKALGVEDQVLIAGFQPDVRPFVLACDTMTLCSVTEALPIAAIEAMALARPVVLSEVGGAREIVVPGQNGELFPVGDLAAYVDSLAALAGRELRARMGEGARQVAESRFSERTMIDRYERLLSKIAAAVGARRPAPAATVPARAAPSVLLLGPQLGALSGVSAHLQSLFGSTLGASFELVHFQVGSEGREERRAERIARLVTSPVALAAAIRRNAARVVHINTSLNARAFWRDLAYLLVAKACGARVVYQVHGGALPQAFFAGRQWLDPLLRRALSCADVIVVLAQSELDAYRRFLPGARIALVPNAIACAPPAPPPVLPPPRPTAAPPPLRLVYIGRLVREKGLRDLVLALADLHRVPGAPRFTIAGSGPEEEPLRRLVAGLGLEGAVDFVGPVAGSEKTHLLRDADLFVLPSYAEGLPYAVLESMAAGTPVVTTRVGAIPDVVTEDVHGVFIPARDPAAIARTIQRLAADRDAIARMGAAARVRVRENFSIDRLAGRFAEIYGELADPVTGWPSPAG